MIQDILTHSLIIFSIFLVLRSFVRFFTVRTNSNASMTGSSHSCGSCNSSCPMKGVMTTIEGNVKEVKSIETKTI